jgi:hypothetical protein
MIGLVWFMVINPTFNNISVNTNNILQDINIMSTSPSFCGICDFRHISKHIATFAGRLLDPDERYHPPSSQCFSIDMLYQIYVFTVS